MTNEEILAKIAELGDLKDKPVTWGDLLETLCAMSTEIMETIKIADECQDKVVDSLGEHVLKLYNEAEYRRMRSMAFVLAITGHTDSTKWYPIYEEFCKEYDKLNRKE
jgi:hypothetical protein